jgi:hypothetical protein
VGKGKFGIFISSFENCSSYKLTFDFEEKIDGLVRKIIAM